MEFPIFKDKIFCTKCIWCKNVKVGEPNSMAILSGGAMLVNRKTGEGGPDDRLDGFLDITWHGAHTSDGGKGLSQDCFANLAIVRDIRGGQFDLYFCSTKCLRDFLNHAVDELEKKIAGS